MSSREEILSRVRRHQQKDSPTTDRFMEGIVFPDPRMRFAEVLGTVGGKCERVSTVGEASRLLEGIDNYSNATKRCSLVEGLGTTTFDLASVSDPRDLEDVEFAILPGQWAVAENGAVWVTAESPVHRILHFLTQHLAIVVKSDHVVSNLHEAYERVEIGQVPFSSWISGPSKTADIEQSLVIGAHGARSLTVFLIDKMD